MLRSKFSIRPAVIFTILWFLTAHMFQLYGGWTAFLSLFALGAVTTVQRAYYKSLTPPLLTYWLYNAILVIIMLTVPTFSF